MTWLRMRRLIGAMALSLLAILSIGSPSLADSPQTLVLPAGIACNFELQVDILGGAQVNKEFDRGSALRTISAGTGSALTFTNTANGATLSLKANGAVLRTVTAKSDGSAVVDATGHIVLILFPTDVPAGPSTTLNVGRIVYTVDPAGVYTLQQVSGKSTDICAALS